MQLRKNEKQAIIEEEVKKRDKFIQDKHVLWLRAQVKQVEQEATDLYVETNIGNMKWFNEQVERLGVQKDKEV